MRDGDDLLWERILPSEKIDTIFLRDGYCVTLDNSRHNATVYDANNGRKLSVINAEQPDIDAPIPLLYERGHLLAAGRRPRRGLLQRAHRRLKLALGKR